MASSLAETYTLIIPTYERTAYLRRQLTYLMSKGLDCAIYVMDASLDPMIRAENAALCARAGRTVHYLPRPHTRVIQRLSEIIEEIKTPYVSVCGDDDVLLPEVLPLCLDYLNNHPEAVACQGDYFNVDIKKGPDGSGERALDFQRVEYSTPTISAPGATERVVQLLLNYESPWYAVMRRDAFAEIARSWLDIGAPLYAELYQALALIAQGEIARIKVPYILRNVAPGTVESKDWQSFNWFCEDAPEMMKGYAWYRKKLLDFILAHQGPDGLDEDRIGRALDLGHGLYLTKQIDAGYAWNSLCETLDLDEENGQRAIADFGRLWGAHYQAYEVGPQTQFETPTGAWDLSVSTEVNGYLGAHNLALIIEALVPYLDASDAL